MGARNLLSCAGIDKLESEGNEMIREIENLNRAVDDLKRVFLKSVQQSLLARGLMVGLNLIAGKLGYRIRWKNEK